MYLLLQNINKIKHICPNPKNILSEIGINTGTITIYIDNKAAIFSSENNVINNKLKHIDIRYHFIRELINNKTIKLEYIKSSENLADGLTKFLNGTRLRKFRDSVLNKIWKIYFRGSVKN